MAFEDLVVKNYIINMFQSYVFLPMICIFCTYFVIKRYYNSVYAYILARITLSRYKSIRAIKTDLFSPMLPHSNIVEIGAGSGENFEFYPDGCSVKCVEPKVEFEKYVTESVKKKGEHLKTIEFVQGTGEALSQFVSPNSMDYAVCTLVLCSVQDVRKVAEEIKMVLKPGGKFFFFEHVHAPKSQKMIRLYQNMTTPFLKVLLDNCHWNREPWVEVEKAGFAALNYQRKQLERASVFSVLRWISIGTATK